MRVRLAAALAAIVAVFAAASCTNTSSTSASHTDGTIPLLRVGETARLTALNPGSSTGGAPYGILEGLYKLGPAGQLEPDLAQSVSHPSPEVNVYHLHHGVKFWDGDEMTSADVANALNYYRSPGTSTSVYYRSVKSIEATDRYTVTLTLEHPDASFEPILAWQGLIFEKKFQDAHKTTMGNPGVLIMGTGAFKVDSFNPNSGLELSANPNWWGGKVTVQHISVKYLADDSSSALAFRAGEIDVAFPLNARAFSATSGAKLVSAPAYSEGYFGMNVHMAPWNDIHVRRAVAYAINRSDVIKGLGNGAMPVSSFIPPSQLKLLGSEDQVNALLKSLPSYPFNLAKAKEELAKSAYPNGFTATTDTIAFGAYTPVTEVIAGALQKIGINLKINVIGFDQYLAMASGPKTFGNLYCTFNLPSPDASSFPSFLLGSKNIPQGGWNFANYDPPEIDALLNEGLATQDPGKRLTVYGKLLKILATDVPYVPLYLQDYNLALSTKYQWPAFNPYYNQSPWALNVKVKG